MKSLVISGKEVKMDGHVYVLEVAEGVCKVGATNSPKSRFSGLRSVLANGFLNTFVSDRTDNYMKLEKMAHAALVDYKVRNEIFEIEFQEAVRVVRGVVAHGYVEPAIPVIDNPMPKDALASELEVISGRTDKRLIKDLCIELGFSDETASQLDRLNASYAQIAVAACLSGEAPGAEVAYSAAQYIDRLQNNWPVTLPRSVAALLY